ncbi:MAG: hypothetical protein M1830_008811 [Pleopsidium flavum]|nr:MAG: hypothetical protein M1830_008811 [Pleopsidium flavum]
MSSPYPTPRSGFPEPTSASSPGPYSATPDSNEVSSKGVSSQPMRLKVLYTFDDQNKTNCLARWPQILNIRTAYMDETTQIGVIELKTCIQAIVAASPELVAKLGQDYTVYAYDYSEYETPLVGQGMLSWVLASASSTPSAPAHQSRTVVTGRVCKNILGLFSNGVQETLEVKLRLVPVPTCLQSEYLNNMQKYRELSKVMPEGFDAGAWTAFLQANPAIMQLATNSRSQSPVVDVTQRNCSAIEHVHQLLSESTLPRDSEEHYKASLQDASHDRDCSRGDRRGSPLPKLQSPAMFQRPSHSGPSRPTSSASSGRPSVQHRSMSNLSRRASLDTGYASNDDGFEEGPTRKRAKVTKAEWPGRNTFGKQPESLRVAASTAASIRVYQPKPVRPSAVGQGSLEDPPRAPTPIPAPANQMQRRSTTAGQSSLRLQSYDQDSASYKSPYDSVPDLQNSIEANMTSPEDSRTGSMDNTPPDIASSPPIMRNVSPAPSSPGLPVLRRDIDSGFMSGSMNDLFEEGDDEMRSVNEEDLEIAAQYSKRTDAMAHKGRQNTDSYSGFSDLPPNKRLPHCFTIKAKRETRSTSIASNDSVVVQRNAQSLPPRQADSQIKVMPLPQSRKAQLKENTTLPTAVQPPARAMERTASTGSVQLPQVPTSDPVRPYPSSLQRSQTWSGQRIQHPASDAPTSNSQAESTSTALARGELRSGSGARRKKAIQERLATSIATGEMPPYCENCGAIETPTWRKAWVRIHSGTPELVRLSDEDGGIVAWEALERDKEGVVTLFRIIKRSLLSHDAGFTEILLCNPCGLWLNKFKCMRPKEKWNKDRKDRNDRRRRGSRTKKAKTGPTTESQSAVSEAHASALAVNMSFPADTADENIQEADNDQEIQLPPRKRARAASMQSQLTSKGSGSMSNAAATAALQRAIQSSPARFMGSQHSPIEVDDLTPKPTRRLLFPSPRAVGEVKALEDRSQNTVGRSRQAKTNQSMEVDSVSADQADKENCPPPGDEEDDLAHLFEDGSPDIRPTTPTPTSKRSTGPFKTPDKLTTPTRKGLTPADIFSSAAKALLLPPYTPNRTLSDKTRTVMGEMTPFTAQLNQLLSEASASPSATAAFDFPSLPSLDGNTPRSGRSHDQEFDFSHFDPQDLLSTDVPMPSSPPAFFALYEDPVEPGSGLWSDYHLSTSPAQQQTENNDALDVVEVDGHDGDGDNGDGKERGGSGKDGKMSKTRAITVDFSALIDEVVGAAA